MVKNILFAALLACCLPAAVRGAEYNPTEVGIVENIGDIAIYFDGTTLRVTNAAGQNLYVYNITGVRVMSVRVDGDDKSFKLNLQRGCYIVKVGNVVRKIAVK